ncbi:MAG: restriction endonuclease [Nitrospinae bacterium]|nr:restriction endonuclease [Nitrospinota bacterium]
MAVPDFQTMMLPLLQFYGDEQEHTTKGTREHLAKFFQLTEEDIRGRLPSGTQTRLANRANWARYYLRRAGLLNFPARSLAKITDRGKEVLKENPPEINISYLDKFPEFVEFRTKKNEKGEKPAPSSGSDTEQIPPLEAVENGYQTLREELAQELLDNVKNNTPGFFEKLVVELLVNMGYGGSIQDAGVAIGRSGDEGIDGVIKEDHLGLDVIYIQAKKWDSSVGRPEIQKFAGALQGKRAKKGVFITTSSFSREAVGFAKNIENKIVLVDGDKLAKLMIDFDIGVSPLNNYQIKKIDQDYFEE